MKTTTPSIITLLVLALGLMGFTNNEAKESKSSGGEGFYYCYIKGYYNGDRENEGYVFSSIEEYDQEPQSSCSGWKEYAEKNESHFTAICGSYTLIGPFSFSHEAHDSMQKKIKVKKNAGYKISEWNKGPRKN